MKTTAALNSAELAERLTQKPKEGLIQRATIAEICNVALFELRSPGYRDVESKLAQATNPIPTNATKLFI